MVTLFNGQRTLGVDLSNVMGRKDDEKLSANRTAWNFCSCLLSERFPEVLLRVCFPMAAVVSLTSTAGRGIKNCRFFLLHILENKELGKRTGKTILQRDPTVPTVLIKICK